MKYIEMDCERDNESQVIYLPRSAAEQMSMLNRELRNSVGAEVTFYHLGDRMIGEGIILTPSKIERVILIFPYRLKPT